MNRQNRAKMKRNKVNKPKHDKHLDIRAGMDYDTCKTSWLGRTKNGVVIKRKHYNVYDLK